MVDRIFRGDVLTLPVTAGRRLRRDGKDFWDADDIEYYFYLNHNEIKITNTISDQAVIFKLIPRVILPTNNILVIKCVKRNLKYTFQ
jgi:hypothetical protein